MKWFNSIVILIMSVNGLFAQDFATIKGQVLDKTSESFPFANILLEGEKITYRSSTDYYGNYIFDSIPKGQYIIKAAYVTYLTESRTINVKENRTYVRNIELEQDVIIGCWFPKYFRINIHKTQSSTIIKQYEIENMHSKDLNDIISLSNKTIETKNDVLIEGRSIENSFYIDGIPVSGRPNIPINMIKEVEIITSGTPARFN